MKTYKSLLAILICILCTVTFISCKDNSTAPEEGGAEELQELEGVDTPSENIPVDAGSVGLVIDTRPIGKKGYKPATAQVDFPGAFASYSEELTINPNTHVATLEIPADALTDEELGQLDDGVDVTIRIFSESLEELAVYSDNVRVNSSNTPLVIETGMPALFPDLAIEENQPYLIQAMADIPSGFADSVNMVSINIDESFEPGIDAMVLKPYSVSPKNEYVFYFESINDSTYYIKIQLGDAETPYYLRMSGPGNFYNYYATEPEDADYYKFVVTRDENGFIKIDPLSGAPLKARDSSPYPQLGYADITGPVESYTPFRMVAANVEWSVEDRGTEYNLPIVPPAKLEFAYKSILRNCSSALLTETVGRSETQTKSYAVATEESLELFSSHEASVNVTASAEAGFSFFGAGATASVETSAGYTYTTTSTTSTTNTWEEETEESVEVSRIREVEIPPFTAVEVYDAIQSVENVKMPFVQTLRVKGSYDGSDPLSGDEITSQLLANQFGGVVTAIGNDYVDITTKGTITIGKFFEVESRVTELTGVCE